MRIKTFLIIVLLLPLFSMQAIGQTTKRTTSKLEEATLFFQGAELIHSASLRLNSGSNEVYIEGLSPNIDMSSLRVKATNNALISSSEYSIDYLTSAVGHTPVIKKIEDSLSRYQKILDRMMIDVKINNELSVLLQTGVTKSISASENGATVEELTKMLNYYKGKSAEVQATQIDLVENTNKLRETIRRLKAQLDIESIKGNKTSGVLKLNISMPIEATTNFTITYVTSAASWAPIYDVNIRSIEHPVKLDMKAMVRQTTGLDWEKVKLTLSTVTPSGGRVAPLFSTWFLNEIISQNQLYGRTSSQMQNKYSYVESYELQENVMPVASKNKEESKKPLYILDGTPITSQQYSSIERSMIYDEQILSSSEAQQLYGSNASGGAVIIQLKNRMDDYITVSDDAVRATYAISIPYTIPGNGKIQTIDLESKEVKATYKFYSAPRLDSETYLLAEIADWHSLNLLSGRVNVTYDGTYVGEAVIDASSVNEKLALTLGSDKRISVKREKLHDFSAKKTFGSNIQQDFTYQMTIKNNQTRPISFVLKDQYPISTRKDIVVELGKETTGWTFNNKDVGVLSWEETLQPGETKVYKISYSVKYPKDMNINL